MTKTPITTMLDEMLVKLSKATTAYREAEKSVNDIRKAIEAVAKLCEDEDVKEEYLLRLEEIGGKQGLTAAVRSLLAQGRNLTPTEIKEMLVSTGKMNRENYVNPMASIHTTLRRMKESEEIREGVNSIGEKIYGLTLKGQVKNRMLPEGEPQAKKK